MTEFRKPAAACSSNAVRLLKNMRQILTKGQAKMQFCVFNEKTYLFILHWGKSKLSISFFLAKIKDSTKWR